jgi:hypothetical protein
MHTRDYLNAKAVPISSNLPRRCIFTQVLSRSPQNPIAFSLGMGDEGSITRSWHSTVAHDVRR